MKITLTGNPISTNHVYKRHGYIIYLSKEGKDLKERYMWEAKSQWKGKPIEGNVSTYITLFFKDERRRDCDNWNKLVLDSLTGICWKDDSQIKQLSILKEIDKKNPRIEVEINKFNL